MKNHLIKCACGVDFEISLEQAYEECNGHFVCPGCSRYCYVDGDSVQMDGEPDLSARTAIEESNDILSEYYNNEI